MTDSELRFNEAVKLFANANAWLAVDEEILPEEWEGIKKKYPDAVEQIFEAMAVIDKACGFYRDDQVKIEEVKKAVKDYFTLFIEVLSAYRGKPALWLLRKNKKGGT